MRWLVDGYNVIRRAPELKSREQESLEAGRQALCALLVQIARASGVTEEEVNGRQLRCFVCGSFQPFLEALHGSEVISLTSTRSSCR